MVIFAIVLLLGLVLLTACGQSSENKDKTGGGKDTAKSTPITKVDLNDKNNYFAVIDGVKYNFPDTVTIQELLNTGYTVKEDFDLDWEVSSGQVYVGEKLSDTSVYMFKKGVEKYYFQALPINLNEKPSPLKDSHVWGITFNKKEADISIAGGLSIGTTAKGLITVWGEPNMKGNSYSGKYVMHYNNSNISDFIGTFSFTCDEKTDELVEITVSIVLR